MQLQNCYICIYFPLVHCSAFMMELFIVLLYDDSKHNENAKKYFPFEQADN